MARGSRVTCWIFTSQPSKSRTYRVGARYDCLSRSAPGGEFSMHTCRFATLLWCIFVCHSHLILIPLSRSCCLPTVWAQACGSEHKTSLSLSCIFGSFGVLVCFLIPVGLLVEAVSRYCHSWYRLFGHQQLLQNLVLCELVNTLQYHDTVDFVQDVETEDPQLVAEPGVGRNHGKTTGKSR